MHTVIESPTFLRHAKEAGIGDAERAAIADTIAANPTAGDLIQGTGGARKIRFAKPGAGKSGGYRVITFYAVADVPVFLLDVFAKGDRVNLSKAERNALAVELAGAVEDYRAAAKATAERMRKEKR